MKTFFLITINRKVYCYQESHNIFTYTLYTIQKSNLKLNDAEFHSSKIVSLIHMNVKILNEIYKNGHLIAKSMIQSKNVVLTKTNVMKDIQYLMSDSGTTIKNNTVVENDVSKAVYIFSSMSKSQLNNVIFTRNNLRKRLRGMQSNSRAII